MGMLSGPEICQAKLHVAPWMDPLSARLPGLQPVAPGQWLLRDEAFAAQMAYRDRLMSERADDVVSARSYISQAERDLLDAVLGEIASDPGYVRRGSVIYRPDGVGVSLEANRPLVAAARLVQEDMLLLEPEAVGHVLTEGVLCFPASWTLKQKIGRGMMGVHAPVRSYDSRMGQRVERVMRALQPGKAVWRANVLCYNDPHLFQPRLETEARPFDRDGPIWVRVERQTLARLEPSNAIAFTIHTHVVPISALSPEQLAAFPKTVREGGSLTLAQ